MSILDQKITNEIEKFKNHLNKEIKVSLFTINFFNKKINSFFESNEENEKIIFLKLNSKGEITNFGRQKKWKI